MESVTDERPVLVVGVPRSGTTWVQRVLCKTASCRAIYEPDSESVSAAARVAKRRLGRFPVLSPGATAPAYERLWTRAFDGIRAEDGLSGRCATRLLEGASERQRQAIASPGARIAFATMLARVPPRRRPSGRARPVVKSVHAGFALEWIAARWDPVVLIVHRHPYNVLASMAELGMADADRRLDEDERARRDVLEPLGIPGPRRGAGPLERAAWQHGVLTTALEAAAARHPAWVSVTHEALCEDPPGRFRSLADRLGLRWTPACDRFLERSNAPGEGYQVRRVASEQPDRWRDRLTARQVAEIATGLRTFPAFERWAMELDGVR